MNDSTLAAVLSTLLVYGGLLLSDRLPSARGADIRDSFETPETGWRVAERDCALQVTIHRRKFGQGHTGQGCEFLQLRAGSGSYVYLTYAVQRARLIDELEPSVWIKSDRVGLQLLGRVVLPRSRDPRSGEPLTTLVVGGTYEQAGTWQRLAISNIVRQLARQVPSLRDQHGTEVDPREAYLDLMVLNAYGGAGTTDVWLDDLEIRGIIPESAVSIFPPSVDSDAGHQATSQPRFQWKGKILLADGQPLAPRAIQYNGEPLAWLKSIGFNTIEFQRLPTPEELQAAEQLGIWLISPPPAIGDGGSVSPIWDPVIAWNLGRGLDSRSLESTRRQAAQLRQADQRVQRPIIAGAETNVWEYSQLADVLLMERPTIATRFELSEFGSWLGRRNQLARIGVVSWAVVPAEPAETFVSQLAAAGFADAAHRTVSPQQVRMLAFQAVAAGMRGIYFPSSSRLDASDPATRLRAKTLQFLNMELSLVEPWMAAGTAADPIDTGHPQLRVQLLKTERASLLVVLQESRWDQYVPAPPPRNRVSFAVYGSPITDLAYEITPCSLRRLPWGNSMQLVLEEPGKATLIVLTDNSLVTDYLQRQVSRHRADAVRLWYDIAAEQLALSSDVQAELAAAARGSEAGRSSAALAQSQLSLSQRMIQSGDFESAHRFSTNALAELARIQRGQWEQAVGGFSSPGSSPFCASFSLLPAHWSMVQRLAASRWSTNMLAAGDFESLYHMESSGWRQLRQNYPGVDAVVELSIHAPRSGRSSLRMQCWPEQQDAAPEWLESPPIVITTAPVSVRQGQLVRIHGWAKISEPISGSLDGLLIYDSLGGPPLAERLRDVGNWREFTLYRAVPRTDSLEITLALSGYGEAWLDDISVALLDLQTTDNARVSPARSANSATRREPF